MPRAWIHFLRSTRRQRLCVLAFFPLLSALALTACATCLYGGIPRVHPREKHQEQEICRLEEAWRSAVLGADTAVLNSLLADDYMAITPGGTLESKEQTLANFRSGAVHLTAMEVSDRKVRFYRRTVLVTSRVEVRGTKAGRDVSGGFRYTHVYVRDGHGSWKIVSFEASRIHESGER
jgi:ketosteroid isomerase-like protein